MMTSPEPGANPIPEPLRQRLEHVRIGLLRLHKALMEAERIRYERIHGRVPSPGHLLQLVMNDPWFAWLHPFSRMIVRIDELLEDQPEATTADAEGLLASTRALIRPSESGEGFERTYFEALQDTPEVAIAHAHVKLLLVSVSA